MNKAHKISLTDSVFPHRKAIAFLILAVVGTSVLAVIQDFLESGLKHFSFYFSESFLFASFWWIFAPLLIAQYFFIKKSKNTVLLVLLVAFPTVIHILLYPLLVWILSKLFYYHIFEMEQTFRYACANFFALTVLIYSLPVALSLFGVIPETGDNGNITSPKAEFIQTILVADKDTKRLISTSEILYFSASSPYIAIHLNDKKYLHQETLKSIYSRLNPDQFIRIHKSSLVNIAAIVSCKTRFNGDYDISLVNGAVLRVSRNYAENFKRLFFLHGSP